MVARSLLTYPAMFDREFCENNRNEAAALGNKVTPSVGRLYCEWLQLTDEHSSTLPLKSVVKHAFWLVEKHLPKVHRNAITDAKNFETLHEILRQHWPQLCD